MKEKLLNCLGSIIGIILIGVLIYFGMKWQKSRDDKNPWIGTFYKIIEEEKAITDSERFETIDMCRDWADERASFYSLKEGEWDYECGTGCEFEDDTIVSGKKVNTYECSEVTK
jgi:hypothetical protein